MNITPEEQLRLSACIEEIAQILYKNTDGEEIATLEGLEKVVRQQMRLIRQPKSCPFFIQKVTKTVKGRSRTLNSCIGRLKITQTQANRLGVESYSRRSPLLDKCCFLLSASESYQNASVDLYTLTGVKVSHSAQHRLVQRQEFSYPQAKLAIAQLSIDGGKVRLKENLYKVGGSRKRIRQAEALLWRGRVEDAQAKPAEGIAIFDNCHRRQVVNFLAYLKKHRLRLVDYETCQKLQPGSIGSGAVESAVKQIGRRLKISGAQWKSENVSQMLQLRCAYLNGEFAV